MTTNAKVVAGVEMVAGVHPFEVRGLGKAPFRLIAVEHRVGPLRPIDPRTGQWDGVTTIGAPGQPMGVCNYCGQGIANVFVIRSADGRTFEVGCDCVAKVGDAKLVKAVNAEVRKAAKKSEAARIEALATRLNSDVFLQTLLASQPSPTRPEFTLLNTVRWLLDNAGHAGKMRAVRMAAKAEKEAQ